MPERIACPVFVAFVASMLVAAACGSDGAKQKDTHAQDCVGSDGLCGDAAKDGEGPADGGNDGRIGRDGSGDADDMGDGVADLDSVPDNLADTSLDGCGNSVCEGTENCIGCPQDCECSCGDGVCSFGEFCAVCPADCDCTTLAATPPMGWNSWNLFACDIDEDLIKGIADALVESGMAEAGYRYVNLDDCWQVSREEDGTIVADPERFPSGIPALADYVHGLGLKFGLYTCAGTMTCQERPGSYGYEFQDAATYAEWGIDFVKVDWCYTEGLDSRERYSIFHDAIAATGHEILLSICNWGVDSPWIWGPGTGSMWRTSHDIFDHPAGMMMTLFSTEPTAPFARIGHWNDPDMLEVGNGGMTDDQYRAHMSLWAVLAAPLLAGNDLRDMSQATKDILLNPEVIAVDQDPAGFQGVLLHANGPVKVYGRPLTMDGLRAVVLYNTDIEAPATGKIAWYELGLNEGKAEVRDLWKHEDLGTFSAGYSTSVPPGGAVMILVSGTEPMLETVGGTAVLSTQPYLYEASWGGAPRRNMNANDEPLMVGGKTFDKGFGVHSGSKLAFHLGGGCTRFTATAGIDGTSPLDSAAGFEVWTDNKLAWSSGKITYGTGGINLDIDITGARTLTLAVAPDVSRQPGDLCDWAMPQLVCPSP